MCVNNGMPNNGTNGNLMVLVIPTLKHCRVHCLLYEEIALVLEVCDIGIQFSVCCQSFYLSFVSYTDPSI